MKRISITLLLAMASVLYAKSQTVIQQTLQKLTSPNGAYEFTFYQKEVAKGEKQMYYTLNFKGKTVVNESELGVLIDNQTFESALAVPNDTCRIWGENLNFTGAQRTSFDQTWKPVYGQHSSIRNNYNEITICFKKGSSNSAEKKEFMDKEKSYFMNVIARAYNEGIAMRYHFPAPTNGLFLHIVGEQTQFSMPEGTLAYYEPWAQGPYSLLPLKDWKSQSERPLVLKLVNGLSVAIAEAQMVDYARMKFSLNPTIPNTLQATLYGSVDVIPAYSTPWRVIMAAEKATGLIADNDIIQNLNPENQIKDVSWIKPGKCLRVTQLNQAATLKCIDFAAEHNMQYILFDSGWYGPEMDKTVSALKVSDKRDIDIEKVTTYAASKGIGLWVYVNQRAMVQQLDSILPLYKKWGIKGIKYGFVQIGNQYWTTWLHESVKKCAEYGIMVDIHDEYRPTGFSRTYPNLLTQEGIRGNEEFPDATHNTILPFTRLLAGPADYTICYYSPKLQNTHAHQLALSVVIYSPFEMLFWYDNPLLYKGEPEIEFFDKVKTTWDDSKILNGEIGQYITIARRSGNDWFVGSITNKQARKIAIITDFLEKGKRYSVKMYQDDDKIPTKTKVSITEMKIKGGDVLHFDLKASGGVAIMISPTS